MQFIFLQNGLHPTLGVSASGPHRAEPGQGMKHLFGHALKDVGNHAITGQLAEADAAVML